MDAKPIHCTLLDAGSVKTICRLGGRVITRWIAKQRPEVQDLAFVHSFFTNRVPAYSGVWSPAQWAQLGPHLPRPMQASSLKQTWQATFPILVMALKRQHAQNSFTVKVTCRNGCTFYDYVLWITIFHDQYISLTFPKLISHFSSIPLLFPRLTLIPWFFPVFCVSWWGWNQLMLSLTTVNHNCQSQLPVTTANHMCQSQLSITAVNHIRTLLWRRRSWRQKQAAWQRRSHDSAWALPTPVKAGSSPTYVLLGQSNQSSHSATHFQPTCYNTRSQDKKSMFL